jgi:hypothetical protein
MPRKKYNIHYLYKTTCVITKRYYFGIHSTFNIDDGYLGSGKLLRRSIRKYGKQNHTKEIINFFGDRKSAEDSETVIINENYGDKFCMNLTNGGKGFKMNHTDETKLKISKSLSKKTYEEIHGKEKAEFEKEKRKQGAFRQWSNIDGDKKKSLVDKIRNSVKEYYRKNPNAKIIKEYKCPHCDKIGGGNGMFRWHFDKCRLKK